MSINGHSVFRWAPIYYGNRCERGARIKIKREERKVNLVDYKYRKLFKYRPLRENKAFRGRLGIPRVLNMYENYPLWHTFLLT